MAQQIVAQLDKIEADFLDFRDQKLAKDSPDIRTAQKRMSYQCYLSRPAFPEQLRVYCCGLKPYGWKGGTFEPPALEVDEFEYLSNFTLGPFGQRAVMVIQAALGIEERQLPRQVLLSNWFWQRAADSKQLKSWNWTVEDMLPFQKAVIDTIQPRLILSVGNGMTYSSFAGMCQLFNVDIKTVEKVKLEQRQSIKYFEKDGTFVLGVPHLSRFYPDKNTLEEIRKISETHDLKN